MLEMLHGAWSRSSVRFVSDAVAFCQAQVSLTANDFIAWSLGEVSYFDGSMGLFRRPETSRKKMRIKGGGTTEHFSGGLSNVVVRVLPSRE